MRAVPLGLGGAPNQWGREMQYWVVDDACGRCHWGLSAELSMGPRNGVLGVADACGHPHWGLTWSSLWGHEAVYW
eukprot:7000810-Pyramimonas_sp.AAC.1